MGILNVTDDSFSGDGLQGDIPRAIALGMQMVEMGADLLDIGAESSRPGALPVHVDVELARVLPVIDGLRQCGVPLSIDTVKPLVMRQSIDAGVDMINDIGALRGAGALEIVAGSKVAVCLMHMEGKPETMQANPMYVDVVSEVAEYLLQRAKAVMSAGVEDSRIVIDPGFGFGKTMDHNITLLRGLRKIAELGFPVLAGLSRKSTLGLITGRAVTDRVYASIAAAMLAVSRGASIVRVHDVAATRDALAILNAVENG